MLFVAILALGLAVRFYRIDYQSFWNDEVLTVFNTNLPLAQVIINPNDINILPLYYLTIYPFLKFGNAEFWLRFPSAFVGVLSLALFFFILKKWLGEKIALVGAFLFSLSPFHVWYSQEARPYALLVFLGLLAMWLFQKVESQPDRPGPLVALVLVTVSTLYCHTVAIPFVGMIGLFLLVGAWNSKRKTWFGAVVGIALLSLPAFYRLLIIPPVGSANTYQEFNPLSLAYT
ncbi:MAG: phospholipid carrier-dependent glycosyltransferase, partial [Calditrichaeota bacterium]